MKSSRSKTTAVIFALLALGAAVVIALSASPVNHPADMTPSPSVPASLSPSPTPKVAPSPTTPPTPSPTVVDGPLSGYILGIDPGHQAVPNPDTEPNSPNSIKLKAKVSAGARGSFTGLSEYELNLSVALKLKDKLEALGAAVIMTRETNDVDISNSQRAKMMNEAEADCWVRIHANNSGDPNIHGMFMLVPAKGCLDTSGDSAYEASLSLAETLLDSALASTGAYGRGVFKRSDQTGFNWSKIPVCTIEMGFMTNEDEDKLLASDEYQQKIADGLAQGFVDYFPE
jgi:N-acetylmuramoyl-L-alanine amidase